ncbi:hypothetical protein [Brachybacterium sp. NPDC056505]|uniref:hypothetical protein n=1 Tax=Brachybacterium sp. NPDC056505 TaxID=3345843 RepID=UPI00366A7FFF
MSTGTLTHTLNGHDELTVTFARADLAGVDESWWQYLSGTVLVTYTDASLEERIVSACPITSAHPEEDLENDTLTLQAKGVSWLLEGRVVLTKDYDAADAADMRATNVTITGRTFRAIAAEVVYRATEVKRSGHLPIVLPSRTEKGDHERTYEGYNVANNGAWKRLTELTEVIGGPDLQFRPEWADEEHTRFQWRLIVGTDAQQTLPQTRSIQWDATSARTDVAAISVTSDATQVAHRVYATGAGEGAGITLAQADAATIPQWVPLVESVLSDTDAEDDTGTALLASKAQGALSDRSLDQITLTVRADPLRQPIGSWWCGELAKVTTGGLMSVADGDHWLRLISCKYDLATDMVDVECQEDHLTEAYEW